LHLSFLRVFASLPMGIIKKENEKLFIRICNTHIHAR